MAIKETLHTESEKYQRDGGRKGASHFLYTLLDFIGNAPGREALCFEKLHIFEQTPGGVQKVKCSLAAIILPLVHDSRMLFQPTTAA